MAHKIQEYPMQLRINEERKELKSHGSAEFPVNVSLECCRVMREAPFYGTGIRRWN